MKSQLFSKFNFAGWRSSVARKAHNLEVVGSNPAPATSWAVRRNNDVKRDTATSRRDVHSFSAREPSGLLAVQPFSEKEEHYGKA